MSLTNGSKEGYQRGFSDGSGGKSNNPMPIIEGFKQALRPQSYTDTYLSGYSSGWTDGNRKRNGV
jgi:hypothetical protein